MMGTLSHWSELNEAERSQLLQRPKASFDETTFSAVTTIVDTVRNGGDEAVRALTQEFDGVALESSKVGADEIAAAAAKLSKPERDAIDMAISNVKRFHEQQIQAPIAIETMPGVLCERVTRPIDAVGLYVPAGTAPLPSAAIMLAVPAVIASCPKITMCTPPRVDGAADPAVLLAASRAGVKDIHTIGGAQAIAAMAYGTESVPKANKIFGPGNTWVTSAKIIVSSDPAGAAIDMPAGPSEVLVIADHAASAEFVAADLLSQAEHGLDSQVILVATSAAMAASVRSEIDRQLREIPRAEIASAALAHSQIIVVEDIPTALEVSNRYAPEHLILQIENPRSVLGSVRNAGSVFVGQWTPESVGDYCSGTNHVLPTSGCAAMYSGLGVDQFERRMTIQELDRNGLESLAATVVCLARLEGLEAHAAAVTRRVGGEQ